MPVSRSVYDKRRARSGRQLAGTGSPIGWYVAQIGFGANRLPSKIPSENSAACFAACCGNSLCCDKIPMSFNNLELSRGGIDVVFMDIIN